MKRSDFLRALPGIALLAKLVPGPAAAEPVVGPVETESSVHEKWHELDRILKDHLKDHHRHLLEHMRLTNHRLFMPPRASRGHFTGITST